MTVQASAVVHQPAAVVETALRAVESWPGLLGGLVAVRRTGHERYVFTVRQGRREHEVLVAVRHDAPGHRIVWRALEGAPWDGTLRVQADGRRRTTVTLGRRVHPRSFLASVAELLGARGADPAQDLLGLDAVVAAAGPATPRGRVVSAAERTRRTGRPAADRDIPVQAGDPDHDGTCGLTRAGSATLR